jgi:CDGSH iron-sulfur domain-containing protein 3
MEAISAKELPKVAVKEPAGVMVEPGKVYSWCSCGLTLKEPFCDSSHKQVEGMPFRSIKVQFDKAEEVWLCQCKQTKTPPFCDGSHKKL